MAREVHQIRYHPLGKRATSHEGGILVMERDESSRIASVLGPPLVVVITALLLTFIPAEIRIGLTVWALVSFPIGVLFGHCVLNDE